MHIDNIFTVLPYISCVFLYFCCLIYSDLNCSYEPFFFLSKFLIIDQTFRTYDFGIGLRKEKQNIYFYSMKKI